MTTAAVELSRPGSPGHRVSYLSAFESSSASAREGLISECSSRVIAYLEGILASAAETPASDDENERIFLQVAFDATVCASAFHRRASDAAKFESIVDRCSGSIDPVQWSLIENLIDHYSSMYLQSYSLTSCTVYMSQPVSMDGVSGLLVSRPGGGEADADNLAQLGFAECDPEGGRSIVDVHEPIERIPLLPVPSKYQKRRIRHKKSSSRAPARRGSPQDPSKPRRTGRTTACRKSRYGATSRPGCREIDWVGFLN